MHINPVELLWAIVNFLVLLAILYKFLYGPIMKLMENRQNEIKDNLTQAEEARKDAEAMRAQFNRDMENAKREAQGIVEKATKMGEDIRNQIVTEAREEASKIVQKAREEIQRERDQALADIRDEVASLALLAAGKVIGKTLTGDDHVQLVNKYIQEVGEIQ